MNKLEEVSKAISNYIHCINNFNHTSYGVLLPFIYITAANELARELARINKKYNESVLTTN